ncbi:hypothetical protein PGQ11_005963 [Apiospora arundinis]|uniref:Uncharacterized protein n=1 Tax=Apiospora arundinis TaxID=335852 RepID=A0ABR2IR63_9PEZI
MESNTGQQHTRSLVGQYRTPSPSPPVLSSQGKAATSNWKPKPYPPEGQTNLRFVRFPFGTPSDPDPHPAPPPAPSSPPLSSPSRPPTSPLDDGDDLDPIEPEYVGSECPDCGAIILRKTALSATTTKTDEPPFLAGDDSGIVAHGEAAAGFGYGVGESVGDDFHSLLIFPSIGDSTSFVPTREQLVEADATAPVAATTATASNDAPDSGLKSEPEQETAQVPNDGLTSPKSNIITDVAGEEPQELVQDKGEISNNRPIREEQQPQPDSSSDKNQRQCKRCQQWQPSSQFHSRQHDLRVHDHHYFTTQCLQCRNQKSDSRWKLHEKRRRDSVVPDFIMCPTCRKQRPRSDFQTSAITYSTNAPDGFVQSCRACRLALVRDKPRCNRCTKLLLKSERARILANGGQQLCKACLSSSPEEVPEVGLLSPPPVSPPPSAEMPTIGGAGGSGYSNADENTITAPPAPDKATPIETDSGSAQRKRQCPLSPTKSPNAAKRTKFAPTDGEVMGDEADAIIDAITEADPELTRLTGDEEATSKSARPSNSQPPNHVRTVALYAAPNPGTTATPSTRAAFTAAENRELALRACSTATPGTTAEAHSAYAEIWRIPHEAWMPVSEPELDAYRDYFLGYSTTSQPYSQTHSLCPSPQKVAALQRGVIIYLKLAIPGLQPFLDDLESCRQLRKALHIPENKDDEKKNTKENGGVAAASTPSALRAAWFLERLVKEHPNFAVLMRNLDLLERFRPALVQHIGHLESQKEDAEKKIMVMMDEKQLDNEVRIPEVNNLEEKKKIFDYLQWRFG